MTRAAYELTQFVDDLRAIAAETHDPRAIVVRVPRRSTASTRASARLDPQRRQRVGAA